MRIGVISDTHGLLRLEAVRALQDADVILHGGDVGNAEILSELARIAPVTAVRGNNDTGEWAESIAECEIITVEDVQIYMLHDLKELAVNPVHDGHRVVVSGHSHKPSMDERDGVLYLNPGSAGPRRFTLPVSVARLDIDGNAVSAEIIELDVPPPANRKRRRLA